MGIYRLQHLCLKFPCLRYTGGRANSATFPGKSSQNTSRNLRAAGITKYANHSTGIVSNRRVHKTLPCSLADAERLATANPHQVQTVITLCEASVKRRAVGVRYRRFPVRDAQPIPIALLNAMLEAIYQGVGEGAVLVHCHFGLSRAPTLVGAFLDHTGSVRFEEAIRTLRRLRPEIAPAPDLIRSITSQIVYED
jgi:protein-tyrosine phosphatase